MTRERPGVWTDQSGTLPRAAGKSEHRAGRLAGRRWSANPPGDLCLARRDDHLPDFAVQGVVELVRSTDVALEIDELDQEGRQGWSVVVQGRAQGVAEPDQLVRMWTVGGVVPWASGIRNVFIQIIPAE